MSTISVSAEEVLEEAPALLEPVVDLYQWSTNFMWPTPYALFLDLIGYSVENWGETLYNTHNALGYVELDKLADALKLYAERPRDVLEFVERLEMTE